MMLDLCNSFRDAIMAAGMSDPTSIISDGRVHRFSNGKPMNKAAWYVFNGLSGVFGDWRTGEKHWFYPKDIQLKKFDLTDLDTKAAQLTAQREKETKKNHAQARIVAGAIWERARKISTHPYLINKGVKSFGLREYYTGALIIPGYNVLDELTTLQFIDSNGKKRFLSNSQVGGSYFVIGLITDVLCIAEGYATGATIHQATNYAVVVAFNSGNLSKIVKIFCLKYPKSKIIVCADDDFETKGNPGLTKAKQAAIANHAYLAVPRFSEERLSKETDFNDMSRILGNESVKEAIYHAKKY